nr:DUF4129 domain-containing protein [Psychromicrobium silvestre]
MVRSAEERVVIDPQPGRTADEVTVLLVAAFPSEQAALWETARGFNRVRYSPQLSGQLRIGSAEYQRALRLDQALLDLKAADDGVAQLEWVGPR